MLSTIPNKEIVRRICHLHGATESYLLIKKDSTRVFVLTNITDDTIASCQSELESWAGMKFNVINFNQEKDSINEFISKSEKILPIF